MATPESDISLMRPVERAPLAAKIEIGSSSLNRSSPRCTGACSDIMQTKNSTTMLIAAQHATIGSKPDCPIMRHSGRALMTRPRMVSAIKTGRRPKDGAVVVGFLGAGALWRHLENVPERLCHGHQNRWQDLESFEKCRAPGRRMENTGAAQRPRYRRQQPASWAVDNTAPLPPLR